MELVWSGYNGREMSSLPYRALPPPHKEVLTAEAECERWGQSSLFNEQRLYKLTSRRDSSNGSLSFESVIGLGKIVLLSS